MTLTWSCYLEVKKTTLKTDIMVETRDTDDIIERLIK